MAGNTSTIDRLTLRAQWDSYMPMAAICTHWTITKDQLVRLRDAWALPLRLDRARRYKPKRCEISWVVDELELRASENSLDLAPMVAERATCVTSKWDDSTRLERQVRKPTAFVLARIELADADARRYIDDINRDVQW